MSIEGAPDRLKEMAVALSRAETIIHHAADAIFHLDSEGRTTFANPAAERIFGWTASELLGRKLHDVIHYKHPDGTAFPMCDCPLGHVFTTGVTLNLHEDVFWRRNGDPVPVACSNAAILAEGEVVGSVLIVRDVTERQRAEEHRQLLVNELNHRVKNSLSVVQSIARHSLRGLGDGSEVEAFEGRLVALSAAHNLLTEENWKEAFLGSLLAGVLNPFGGGGARIVLRGPEVRLIPRVAVTLTLAAHELATNAAKYGALSRDGGRVVCEWDLVPAGEEKRLRLEWRESGGPEVVPPARRGFGTRIIEGILAREMSATVQLHFDPAGLRYTLDAPLPPTGEAPASAAAAPGYPFAT